MVGFTIEIYYDTRSYKCQICDVSYNIMDWNRLSQDLIRWRALMDALMDIREG
jgi:hypothetical protein